MPDKNEIYNIKATDITFEGMGVGRADGMAVFASDLLPDETAEVKIIKKLKSYCIGRVESRAESSPFRAEPICPVFKVCGGCTHMHMSYEGQLKFKTAHVANCLKKFSGTELAPAVCVPSPEIFNYRNKISLPVNKEGESINIGCYKKHSHSVVNAEACFIADESFMPTVSIIREYISKYGISVYNEQTCRGLLRHIVLRKSSLGELMVGIVINGASLPHAEELAEALKADKSVKTAVININRERGNVILGRKTVSLFGSGRIREKILDCFFDISLNTFLQVNHSQTERLYSYALSLLSDKDVVCDLYCGAGTITLNAASRAKRIYGVEIVPQAIEDAKRNAELNGITNAEFICGDCAEAFPEIIKREGRIDAVIVDPPRKGLEPSVIASIAESGAAEVIYVSCDPATLSRDLGIFTQKGFTPLSAQPFDMFPQTGHVETVVLMSRKDK